MIKPAQRIDVHVHMVGNGVAGSGGWLRLKGWHRWLAGFMLRQLGVPATALEDDLETIYAEHLGKLVRESSMDAVVLLAHTGGEHTVSVINAALADPRLLRFPLECGVTVIAAHCATKSGAFDIDHFDAWVAMLREFPNLYGDISAMVSLNRCGHLRDCLRPEILSRILHGSDFPVPVLGHRLFLQGWIDWKTLRRGQKIENALERGWFFKT